MESKLFEPMAIREITWKNRVTVVQTIIVSGSLSGGRSVHGCGTSWKLLRLPSYVSNRQRAQWSQTMPSWQKCADITTRVNRRRSARHAAGGFGKFAAVLSRSKNCAAISQKRSANA
jgi:hypothetical protein